MPSSGAESRARWLNQWPCFRGWQLVLCMMAHPQFKLPHRTAEIKIENANALDRLSN